MRKRAGRADQRWRPSRETRKLGLPSIDPVTTFELKVKLQPTQPSTLMWAQGVDTTKVLPDMMSHLKKRLFKGSLWKTVPRQLRM